MITVKTMIKNPNAKELKKLRDSIQNTVGPFFRFYIDSKFDLYIWVDEGNYIEVDTTDVLISGTIVEFKESLKLEVIYREPGMKFETIDTIKDIIRKSTIFEVFTSQEVKAYSTSFHIMSKEEKKDFDKEC